MFAVECRQLGEPEDLVLAERAEEPLRPGKVRIRVTASGVNYVDALFVQGRYQIVPPVPFVPGSEVAGEVIEVGDGVQGWSPGDRVMAQVGLGGYADQLDLPADQLHRLSDSLTDTQGATMGQSYATAWFSLSRRTVARPGEWIAVLGAGGGVGLAVLDVARTLEMNTIAVASSHEKLELCIQRGAHSVVNHVTDDLKTRVRELTGGGADVVVDPIGGEATEAALRALGDFGRLLVIGFAAGDIPRIPTNQVLLRNRSVIGVDWGAWGMSNPDANRQLLDEVMEAAENGSISPVEPSTYPLADAGRALRDLLERRVVGKVALVPESA